MNYIKLKILVGFMLIYLIDQICCETNTLEDKYESGREILSSISIHHENITSIFAEIDKEYNHLSNINNDQNNKSINDFIDLSKKQIVMEVNNLAQILNKFSLDEQSKYEDFIRTNTNTFRERMPLFNDCLERYNSLKKSLRCIDQHENSKNETNNKFHEIIKNLMDTYNSVLIPQIKDIEKDFITATNRLISIAKSNNDELIKKISSISMLSTLPTKNDNASVLHSISKLPVNKTLINLYVNQKNMLNTANLENFIAIQSIILNVTLNHISKVNIINDHDGKILKCCFDYSKVQMEKAKIIAVNDSNQCFDGEMLSLDNLASLQKKEAEKYFVACFYDDNAKLENIFGCMGWLQSSYFAPKILKLTYEEAVNKFNKNQKVLSGKTFNCLYKWRHSFDERLKNLNNQFDICIQKQKPFEKCIEPTAHDSN